jgi:hypothetical protein
VSELSPLPEDAVGSEHLGVRVFVVHGSTHQELVDQIALILGEHMDDGDQLHVSFNAMQNGLKEHPGTRLLRAPEPWTEWLFEYSALVVLRQSR